MRGNENRWNWRNLGNFRVFLTESNGMGFEFGVPPLRGEAARWEAVFGTADVYWLWDAVAS